MGTRTNRGCNVERMSTTAPRTLADQLRGWSTDQLTRFLTARPDLANPAPQDSAQLASRAGTRASLTRAVDQVDLLGLYVLDAVRHQGAPASTAGLRTAVHASPDAVDAAVQHLQDLALLWGTPQSLRMPSGLAEIMGPSLSGLGPSAEELLAGYRPARVAALARDLGLSAGGDREHDIKAITGHLADPEHVRDLVAEIDPRTRAILDHLEGEGRDGVVESTDRTVARGDEAGPVDQLLSRGLLVAKDRRHVAVPREVSTALREGRSTRERIDEIPGLALSPRDPALVDRAAGGAAFELVRHVELLLEHWGTTPPSALRSGGLGVRELKAAADLLHVDERVTALLVELAVAAGLLAVGSTDEREVAWLPTDAFDAWTAAPYAERWTRLATTWLHQPRLVGLVGSRREGKPVNALAPDLERGWLVGARISALTELAAVDRGEVLAAGTGVPSLVARLEWRRPRRPRARAEAVAWVIEEAAAVGVLGLGGLSTHGRALLGPEPSLEVAPLLEPLLPAPIDHVLLQADLTAVAPGPLAPELARRLSLVCDVESRGGATVYRVSDASLRRALDAGWSAAEMHGFFASASRTPVPQGLTYLVDDVARRFGTLRAGTAESFLRSDDEATLTELVHHPRAGALRLRQIAPTVVLSDVPLDVLLPRLRELGAAPVVEAHDGTVRLARRAVHRARTPRASAGGDQVDGGALTARLSARDAARVSATVTAIRAGDQVARTRPSARPGSAAVSTPASTLAVLREATDAGAAVWIGYVDKHGTSAERVVDPVKVEGGWLTAYDRRSEEVRAFAVHRISTARTLDDSQV